jgi:hypothetical protein
MKCFEPKYNSIPKAELHCHLDEILGMSLDEIQVCNSYAVEASFVPEEQKRLVKEGLSIEAQPNLRFRAK